MAGTAFKLSLGIVALVFIANCKNRLESSALADTDSTEWVNHQQVAGCTGNLEGTDLDVDLFVDAAAADVGEDESRAVKGTLVFGPKYGKLANGVMVNVSRAGDTGLYIYKGGVHNNEGAIEFEIQISMQAASLPSTLTLPLDAGTKVNIRLDCRNR